MPLAGLAAACSGNLSALDPAGPAAEAIALLWWVMLIASVVLLALVMTLFLLTLLRPGFGSSVPARRWIVLGGLVLPLPLLTVLVLYSFVQGEALLGNAGETTPMRIDALGRQWIWEFSYVDLPEVAPSAGVLHIPAGRPVDIHVTSADVVHGFWIPRLGGKIDAIPGHTTTIRLFANHKGVFGGVCAEYCGRGHAAMTFVVHAHDPDDYIAVMRMAPERRDGGETP